MTAAIDPAGMPLAIDVVPGQKADDPLYIPIVDRVHKSLCCTYLLFCGDCKNKSSYQIYCPPLSMSSYYQCTDFKTNHTMDTAGHH